MEFLEVPLSLCPKNIQSLSQISRNSFFPDRDTVKTIHITPPFIRISFHYESNSAVTAYCVIRVFRDQSRCERERLARQPNQVYILKKAVALNWHLNLDEVKNLGQDLAHSPPPTSPRKYDIVLDRGHYLHTKNLKVFSKIKTMCFFPFF